MTRLPLSDRSVRGFDGPDYQLSRLCAHPNCLGHGNERHHLWRRSALGGDFNWVVLPDGSACGNIVMLCPEHHRLITENRAMISLESGGFFWVEDGYELLPLPFQPPRVWTELEHVHQKDSFETAGEKMEPVLDNECPVCHQALPRPKIVGKTSEKKRTRRSWTITVPMDRREDGADTLDTLLEEARVELDKAGLGYGVERSVRFFVLAAVLGLFVQHFRELVGDG